MKEKTIREKLGKQIYDKIIDGKPKTKKHYFYFPYTEVELINTIKKPRNNIIRNKKSWTQLGNFFI